MIETRILTTQTKLDPSDLVAVVFKMSEDGWKPALLGSQTALLQIAGVEVGLPILLGMSESALGRRFSGGIWGGEAFFRDQDMYYVVTNPTGRPAWIRYTLSGLSGQSLPEASLEVGVVSADSSGLAERLSAFSQAFENAVKSSLDGRKTRHMVFDWHEVHPGTPRLDKLIEASHLRGAPTFERASLQPVEIEAARVLTSRQARDLLIELSEAGFVREQDILARKSKVEDIRAALAELHRSGLLSVEYLLECKQRGTPLTRLRDEQQLQGPEMQELLCPYCSTRFAQERIAEGYSLSDLGRRMCRRSRWMTIWVTHLLSDLGVPIDSILWNVSDAGEEVDLLMEVLGEVWIFELKDREFGAGDAYPLNYRQVRYKADKSIVVTTERVSGDAKRVFEELARESQRPDRSGPVYIEGLDAIQETMRAEITKAALRYASQRLSVISELLGYDMGVILAERFGQHYEPQREITIEELLF